MYVRPPVQTVGVEVGRQNSLWGREYSGNFPRREIVWQHCIWQPAFFWWEIILVTSKEQERAREKRRRNLRKLSEEILERIRGRRRRETNVIKMKPT